MQEEDEIKPESSDEESQEDADFFVEIEMASDQDIKVEVKEEEEVKKNID